MNNPTPNPDRTTVIPTPAQHSESPPQIFFPGRVLIGNQPGNGHEPHVQTPYQVEPEPNAAALRMRFLARRPELPEAEFGASGRTAKKPFGTMHPFRLVRQHGGKVTAPHLIRRFLTSVLRAWSETARRHEPLDYSLGEQDLQYLLTMKHLLEERLRTQRLDTVSQSELQEACSALQEFIDGTKAVPLAWTLDDLANGTSLADLVLLIDEDLTLAGATDDPPTTPAADGDAVCADPAFIGDEFDNPWDAFCERLSQLRVPAPKQPRRQQLVQILHDSFDRPSGKPFPTAELLEAAKLFGKNGREYVRWLLLISLHRQLRGSRAILDSLLELRLPQRSIDQRKLREARDLVEHLAVDIEADTRPPEYLDALQQVLTAVTLKQKPGATKPPAEAPEFGHLKGRLRLAREFAEALAEVNRRTIKQPSQGE